MIDDDLVQAHRYRALSPDRPVLRGSAQNPDVFFQAREAVNLFYDAVPDAVQSTMDQFAELAGRQYRIFDYVGAPDAERVMVILGSAAGAAEEAVRALVDRGERVGLIKVRLYRPYSARAFVAALPLTTRTIAAMDRTKEPGSLGEPLYLDVVTALAESWSSRAKGAAPIPQVIGGRYGLSSKELTPAMVAAVFVELGRPEPKRHFTVGINDDVTYLSLNCNGHEDFCTEHEGGLRALFYGLGSDGTVGANKHSVKIVGEKTPLHAQGYFVYDSKKSGSITVSHLRFSSQPIHSPYLITRANFVACHQFGFLDRIDVLEHAEPSATFLLNSHFGPEEVWEKLPVEIQEQIIKKRLRFFVVDAYRVAGEAGLGPRINTVMQTCFFSLTKLLPGDHAIKEIKESIEQAYGKRGQAVLRRNFAGVDGALASLHEVAIPTASAGERHRLPVVPVDAPDFVRRVTALMMAGKGDLLPVSALPPDGTFQTGTSRFEKRSIAQEIPIWDPDICIECGLCAMVCPHAVIRSKVYEPSALDRSASELPLAAVDRPRSPRPRHDDPGRPGRLHRLRRLCRRLSGRQQRGRTAQGDQHGDQVPGAPRARAT